MATFALGVSVAFLIFKIMGGFLSNVGKAIGNGVSNFVSSGNVFTAGASVLGSLLNKSSQDKANQTNIDLQREQNQFNSDMFDKESAFNAEQADLARQHTTSEREAQQAWQEKMIQQQQLYDSAPEQIKRLRQAGINTAMMNGSLDAGGSASPSGAPAGSSGYPAVAQGIGSSQMAHVNPAMFDVASVFNNMKMVADAAKSRAEADETNARTPWLVEGDKANVKVLNAKASWTQADEERLRKDTEKINVAIKQMQAELDNAPLIRNLLEMDVKQREIALNHFEERLLEDLNNVKADTKLKLENASEVASKIKLNLANAANSYAQAGLAKANTQLAVDSHILNGVQLRLATENGDELVQFAWDEQQMKHNISVEEYWADVASARARASKESKRTGWFGTAVDYTEIFLGALGSFFGANANFNTSSSTVSAVSKIVK